MNPTTLSPTRWSLTDLLPEPVEASLAAALAELEQLTAAFEARRDELTGDITAEAFVALLHDYEAIMAHAQRLGAYGALWFSAETQNPAALNLRDRVDVALTEIDNRLLFFNLWLKSMPDGTAARLLPATGDLRYFVEVARKFRPHTLSEPEERIINLKDANGIDALVNLYDMITSRFTFNLELDGETKTLTRDQLAAYYRHPSPDVRAATYQELYRVYSDNSTLLAQMYNHRARDWRDEGKLRGFTQPIAARNLANDLPDAVVDTLLDVCARNSGLFQRYFRLKAGWIGMDKLRRYDIYAPLSASTKEFPFGPAFETVLDSFEAFSSQLAEYAARVAAENHLDTEPRAGKRGGAFCYAVLPGLTPWVFMNYTGQARDVATLAHELGHAIHGMSAAHHSNLTFHASLPLAETASVFAEMLLTDRLLADERDPAVRRDLLAAALDDAYATVQRQASFSLFEREAHRLVAEGAPVDALCAAYMDNLRAQFGDAVALSDDFQWEWISIPHFYHVPFYTYAYSFGQLLVLSLYQAYRREGESFIPRYLKLLAYGGSEAPAVILQEAGFDITSADFWQGGYDVLAGMIDELERL
ncbi:M3 family oligoendopeptidase [Promineifilum sp.]|uniref:M3 family oligoendopeptidase n=1 Tax=Promineifilum sp. TaxID=2664178 RepID=UPI0035B4C411